MMPYDDEDDGAAAAFIDRMLSERARCDALLARFDDDIGGTGADAAAPCWRTVPYICLRFALI